MRVFAGPSSTVLPLVLLHTGEQLRKGVGVSQDTSDYPAYFEDHQDYKDFCISYRGDLARIVKLTAGLLPDQALAAASRRLQHSLQQCSSSAVPPAVRYISPPLAVLTKADPSCEALYSGVGFSLVLWTSYFLTIPYYNQQM